MKKILFLTNIPAPYTVTFFSLLGEMYNLTVLFERKNASNRNEEWISMKNKNFTAIFLKGIEYGEEMAFCPEVVKYLQKKYDCIIVGNYSSFTGILSMQYMKKKGIKFYIHVDGGIPGNDKKIKYYIKRQLLSSAQGFLSSGSVTDKYIKKYVGEKARIEHYPFTSVEKKDVVEKPLAKEEKIEERRKLLCELEIDYNMPLIISVGSIIYRKGFDVLINAVAKLDINVNVLIIGGKPTETIAKCMEGKKCDRIFFIDFILPEKVKYYLRLADLFVLPTRYDIWGLVVNEALAAGIPVIASDMCVAGMELIKNDYNGYIFTSENEIELSDLIRKFFENSNEKMYDNALDTAKKYTIESMAERYAECINKIIQQGVTQ